ncbi:DUF6671 family protein [Scytonema sp. NUACC26]|uniref:DUF6671 family protein n=1 Tax=Scytonema sp. NUACC26 TaxID=3140176 RepID=UPI0034DC0900
MKKHPLFNNRVAVLATKHHKEKEIAPILRQELGVEVIVPQDFDTDCFGTFTRDVKRTGTQIEAARLKAETVLSLTNETLALASEGTFSPHPSNPFVPCNQEIIIFLDRTNELKIIGQSVTIETNFSHRVIKSIEEAHEFAEKVGFPEHAVVVMVHPAPENREEIIKGINTTEQLVEAVAFALNQSKTGEISIETDMRALYNPTRMKNIARATYDLIQKIRNACPNCDFPGFDVFSRKKGLPCAYCHSPTELTLAVTYKCQKCRFFKDVMFPDGIQEADPSLCNYCNP